MGFFDKVWEEFKRPIEKVAEEVYRPVEKVAEEVHRPVEKLSEELVREYEDVLEEEKRWLKSDEFKVAAAVAGAAVAGPALGGLGALGGQTDFLGGLVPTAEPIFATQPTIPTIPQPAQPAPTIIVQPTDTNMLLILGGVVLLILLTR
jgi:hypothetical protein